METAPVVALIEAALKAAPDDERREELLVMRASLKTHGLGLAHIHVRLNSSQLHNAARRQVGLETEPNDPANRRSYFNTINDLLGRVQPLTVSFGSLMEERASAKRLMMMVAQIVKFIDAETPIRFLIAETETGFTLLAALYYARLFGVEDRVEISPLFETEEAFERGERVIEEALKSPHYRAYLERQGRIAVQFGFSDSGRFIGQMAATFRIERLRLRLAQLLERHGLIKLEAILFNTHGESIGRGGHPLTFARSLALRGTADEPSGVRAARGAGQGGDQFSGRRRLSAVLDAGRGDREHAADSRLRIRCERRDRQRSNLRGARLCVGILCHGAAGVHRPGGRSGLRGVARVCSAPICSIGPGRGRWRARRRNGADRRRSIIRRN